MGGLYLKPPSVGRIVRGRDDDAVGLGVADAVAVVGQDGVRERGRWRVAERGIDHDGDVVGGQDLERG